MSVDKYYLLSILGRVNRGSLFLIWTLSACGHIQPRRTVFSGGRPLLRVGCLGPDPEISRNECKKRGSCHIHPDQKRGRGIWAVLLIQFPKPVNFIGLTRQRHCQSQYSRSVCLRQALVLMEAFIPDSLSSEC